MADMIQTPANVAVVDRNAVIEIVQVGEAVTQGMPGYMAAGDSKYYQADGNDGVAKAAALGFFLTPAVAGGFAIFITGGLFNPGGTVVVGETYVVSINKGAIAPIGDLASGTWVTHLGIGVSATQIEISLKATGVQVP